MTRAKDISKLITGTTVTDLTVGSSEPDLIIQDTDGTNQFMKIQQVGGASMIKTRSGSNDGEFYITGEVTGTNKMKISTSGQAYLYGSLDVSGATTLTGALTVNDPIQILNGSNVNSASTDADDLIIEGPNDCGLSILSATTGRIFFGDASDNDVGSIRYIHTDNSMRFETNAGERMRINSSGNTGFGITTPLSRIHVKQHSTAYGIVVEANGNDAWVRAHHNNSVGIIETTYDISAGYTPLVLKTGGSERMRIDSSGNVMVGLSGGLGSTFGVNSQIGIGTDNNNRAILNYGSNVFSIGSIEGGTSYFDIIRLTSGNVGINTQSTSPNPGISLQRDGVIGIGRNNSNNDNSFMEFRRNGTQIGSILQNGTTGVTFETSSDYRLKENVAYDFDATTRLKKLKPCRFNFIAEADRTVDGFIAHEVSSIVPEAVSKTKDAVDKDGNPDYQGIDQSKLVPLLVKTIQELEARITTLEGA